MPMRDECKNFQSRTYTGGETVRKCTLDMAPEAPWRCPENCSGYEIRLADRGWRHGSLVGKVTPEEPSSVGQDDSVSKLLDEAENIVNRVTPDVQAEIDPVGFRIENKKRRPKWWPFK